MKKFKSILLFPMLLVLINSIAFADAVVAPYEFSTDSVKGIIIAIAYFAFVCFVAFIVINSIIAKKSGDEEKFQKRIRAIEEIILFLSILYFCIFLYSSKRSFGALIWPASIIFILTTMGSLIIRYKYKDIKNSNIMFYGINIIVFLVTVFLTEILY